MSAKNTIILPYILLSLVVLIIEHIVGVSLNEYHYLDQIIGMFSDVMTPMQPTTGDWAKSAEDAAFMMDILRFFLRVLSSPLLFLVAIIVYFKME